MTKKRPPPAPYQRTTVPLTATIAKAQAHLDLRSVVALAYAQEAHRRAGRINVPAAGVIRRALSVYVQHLATVEPRSEFRATEAACKPLCHQEPEEAHSMALLRLYAGTDEEPLPSFEVVLDGPRVVAERAALHQRLETVLESLR